jgi:tRNA dimethylallyltransferase
VGTATLIDPAISVICIVGPTASGKTELAIRLARQFDGEIICADSRTVYEGMSIGTAKPTADERAQVPHHLLDLIKPNQTLSAAEFKRLAEVAINDIWIRGKIPFLVGGSGLYLDAVIYDYQFPPEADPALRAELEQLSDEQLKDKLEQADPEAFATVDLANRRRVTRAIETAGLPKKRQTEVPPNFLLLGLDLNKEVAQDRIQKRVENMLSKGLFDEVRQIGEHYGWDAEALQAPAYKAFKEAVLGRKTVAVAAEDFARADQLLAKKQRTWFRRNQSIHWLENPTDAETLVADFLARTITA